MERNHWKPLNDAYFPGRTVWRKELAGPRGYTSGGRLAEPYLETVIGDRPEAPGDLQSA